MSSKQYDFCELSFNTSRLNIEVRKESATSINFGGASWCVFTFEKVKGNIFKPMLGITFGRKLVHSKQNLFFDDDSFLYEVNKIIEFVKKCGVEYCFEYESSV